MNRKASKDPVQTAIEQFSGFVHSAKIVEAGIVQVHSQTSITKLRKMVGLPAIAIAYMGLTPKTDSSATGAATYLNMGVFLVGGDLCEELIDDVVQNSITMLGDIRCTVVAECANTPGTHRKWTFVGEVPVDFGSVQGYLQRWRTHINILPR